LIEVIHTLNAYALFRMARVSQRFAVTCDQPALCSIDASLEELRKKIMDAAKCAVP
jgi:hypothetical protein